MSKVQYIEWSQGRVRVSTKTMKKPDTDTTLPLEVSATGTELPSWPPQTSLSYESVRNFTPLSMP